MPHIPVKDYMHMVCFDTLWFSRWLDLLYQICVWQILGLYHLSDILFNWSREVSPLLPPSPRFVFSSSSMRIASSSGQIIHLLGQDITLGRDNKHLISEKLMIIGSFLTFLLSLSAMSAFSNAPTSLICKLLGSSVGSQQGTSLDGEPGMWEGRGDSSCSCIERVDSRENLWLLGNLETSVHLRWFRKLYFTN